MISDELQINRESVRQMVTQNLGILKTSCRLVPHHLTDDQKQVCSEASQDSVETPNSLNCIVTENESRCLSDEAHFWLNGYVNKQNCRIWSEANPQVYVETPLHPEKLTVWCALWAGGVLQKR
ncbi:hypothetical protein TNCV_445921 [Trichonephila clavipes]|nr:hypothetical protein TNCV_445921 [Trichonephila clavipes]